MAQVSASSSEPALNILVLVTNILGLHAKYISWKSAPTGSEVAWLPSKPFGTLPDISILCLSLLIFQIGVIWVALSVP